MYIHTESGRKGGKEGEREKNALATLYVLLSTFTQGEHLLLVYACSYSHTVFIPFRIYTSKQCPASETQRCE